MWEQHLHQIVKIKPTATYFPRNNISVVLCQRGDLHTILVFTKSIEKFTSNQYMVTDRAPAPTVARAEKSPRAQMYSKTYNRNGDKLDVTKADEVTAFRKAVEAGAASERRAHAATSDVSQRTTTWVQLLHSTPECLRRVLLHLINFFTLYKRFHGVTQTRPRLLGN